MPARHLQLNHDDPEVEALRSEIGALSMHTHWHTPLMSQVIVDLLSIEPPARLLDIGCGNGELVRQVLAAQPASTAVAVDALASHLALTRERLAPYGSRVQLIEAALEDIASWPDLGQVTVATLLNVLHFIDAGDLPGILSVLVGRLAPGGLLLASQSLTTLPAWDRSFAAMNSLATARARPHGDACARLAELMRERQRLDAAGRTRARATGFVHHTEAEVQAAFTGAGLQAVVSVARMGSFVLIAGRRPG